ncbi:hypothetical protein AYO21_04900 [Fonsecaea monophora]|uniref:Uncharacterized protein n=1 Tax=Fonsecaea monophora TaxID=254056 RepID=A0A177F9C3_9EURO|nr:hypothetical protein AYO21_04900 [Fonsecaea monophora]OAG40823.1 hypothetical protein AYO21_04900 [Fonsecaea monophora]
MAIKCRLEQNVTAQFAIELCEGVNGAARPPPETTSSADVRDLLFMRGNSNSRKQHGSEIKAGSIHVAPLFDHTGRTTPPIGAGLIVVDGYCSSKFARRLFRNMHVGARGLSLRIVVLDAYEGPGHAAWSASDITPAEWTAPDRRVCAPRFLWKHDLVVAWGSEGFRTTKTLFSTSTIL